MSEGLVFVTGASGFIGCATALETLKAGYRLRLSVRNEAQIPKIRSALSSYSENVEFIVVHDITRPDAFAGHLVGVDYVLHIASPLPKGMTKEDYFPGAISGTTAILSEAAKVASIKRVVITSSIASLMPLGGVPSDDPISEHNDNWNTTISADLPIFESSANPLILYQASKLLALQAAESFVSTTSPGFDIVTIHPSLVCGPDVLQSSPAEVGVSNGVLFSAVMTGEVVPDPSALTLVHVNDVAEAHVKALKPGVLAGRYLVSSPGGVRWSDIVAILVKKFPGESWKLKEKAVGQGWNVNTTKAEKGLSLKLRGLDEIIGDTVAFQLQLLKDSTI
ncbi:NAD dependent epimerase/dehydratase [Aspergillus fischeri NRRL 181]|uniref:NAD dependent epimerase/dehydratase n=1 Tax=Neosartorya fischeri (strain ATCC 1020 / DSM 3700 / CBS 544.65 / FGSC A1164 / JCM 1740 / NRRL 181 / WB 181) TaxID=331117 RepID=A1D8M2_NEOFI|nr:NAD dependent epimerase/dehydratase [Aspergillus fischeri NRRL 181]EAW20733.1 NAD dependent epimerase/dehydratase [Aspergillus fischeri NRRL 181]KAG2002074.1 hypothetical protein GB937_009739 [Aspergillus fischeri]